MEEEERLLLLHHRRQLLQDITNVKPILDILLEERIFTVDDDDYQAVLAEETPIEQVRTLLEVLPSRGPRAFQAFVRALCNVRPHLAQLFAAQFSSGTTNTCATCSFQQSAADPCDSESEKSTVDAQRPANRRTFFGTSRFLCAARRIQTSLRRSARVGRVLFTPASPRRTRRFQEAAQDDVRRCSSNSTTVSSTESNAQPQREEIDGGQATRTQSFSHFQPRVAAARKLQEQLRDNYRRLVRKVSPIDYQKAGRTAGGGLHNVFVAVSSLDFNDAQAMLSDKHKKLTSSQRVKLAATPLVERQKERVELSSSRRLLRLPDGGVVRGCLVAGNGGTGKTLLMYKILTGWAEGTDEEMQKFEFVFYVSGRDRDALQSKTTLGLLGLDRYDLTFAEEKQVEEYLTDNARKILVILDGGDEIGNGLSACAGLQALLERRSLSGCTFVFTSRPCSSMYDVVPLCDTHFYLDGFSEERLGELLCRRLGNESGSRLSSELKQPERRQLWELMRETPLLANMVAELAKEQESLPHTTTDIYMTMMKNTMRRFAAKHSVEGAKDLSRPVCNWPEGLREPLRELSELALSGLEKSQFVFDMAEVKVKCSATTLRTGVVQEVETESITHGHRHNMQFSHLTWQEFFAALAVVQNARKQEDAFHCCTQSVGVGDESQPFWRFVCGLCETRHLPLLMQCLDKARQNQNLPSTGRPWTIFMLSCCAEAIGKPVPVGEDDRSSEHLDKAMKVALPSPSLDLRSHPVTVSEMTSLSVTLQYAKHVDDLRLANCNLSQDAIAVLASRPFHCKSVDLYLNRLMHSAGICLFALGASNVGPLLNLSTLSLCGCGLDKSDAPALQELLHQLPNLTTLRLSQNHLDGNAVQILACGRGAPLRLEYLSLTSNPVLKKNAGGSALAKLIANSPCLQTLRLVNTQATTTTVGVLLASLPHSRSIQLIQLSQNRIADDVIKALAQALNSRHRLLSQPDKALGYQPLKMHLHGNCINDVAVQRLASLVVPDSLDTVEINSIVVKNGCISGRDWAAVIEERVQQTGSDVDLKREGICCSDAAKISEILKDSNCQLSTLELYENRIGDEGLCTLADALQSNTSLRALSVLSNSFSEIGISAVAEALSRYNSTLCVLDLGRSLGLKYREGYSQGHNITLLVGHCKGLRYLGLNKSGLGERDGRIIGDALALRECALRILVLRGNRLRSAGALDLGEGLKENQSLQFLDLSDNGIDDRGAAGVVRCVRARADSGCPLQQVWMGDNPVDGSVFSGRIVSRHFVRRAELGASVELCQDMQ